MPMISDPVHALEGCTWSELEIVISAFSLSFPEAVHVVLVTALEAELLCLATEQVWHWQGQSSFPTFLPVLWLLLLVQNGV